MVNVSRQADEEEEVGIMTRSKCECEGNTELMMRVKRKVIQGVKGGEDNSLQRAMIAMGLWNCNLS